MKLCEVFVSATEEKNEFTRHVPAPYIRKSFTLEKAPVSAGLNVCGLGFYRMFVNGRELTRGVLAPYISNSDDMCCYDIYDLKNVLRAGKNAVTFLLGNGMQNGIGGRVWDFETAAFRSSPKLACSLECDGETVFASMEDAVCADSPILFDDLRSGERYDMRLYDEKVFDADYDDSAWEKVMIAETPKGEKRARVSDPVVISHYLHGKLIGTGGFKEPEDKNIVKNCSFPLPEDEVVTRGYVYDFGFNTAGMFRVRLNAREGQKVILQFGEVFENGVLDITQMYFLPHGYDHRAVLVCREGENIYSPSFTYFGARYCLISGIDEEQAKELDIDFGVCHSDLRRRGFFACSDPIANALYANCIRSDLANFVHFPTDCPQREKNGWTGDASVSAEQYMTNFECLDSFAEWLKHIQKAQRPSGELPGIIPTGGWGFAWGNGPGWDAVCVNLPYAAWEFDGDTEILRDNADMIDKYFDYLDTKVRPDGLYEFGLGDWCPVGMVIKAPLKLTDSCTLYDILCKGEKIFEKLGMRSRAAKAKEKAARLRAAIRKELINGYTAAGECQTSQAMTLYYGIFDEDEFEPAYKVLMDMIDSTGGHFDGGIFGARTLFRLLAEHGDAAKAFDMICRTDGPSFGEWVAQGATSMYENFGEPQSRNHHFFGDISAFFIKHIAGIDYSRFDGVPRAVISPAFVPGLDFARGETCGVRAEWRRKGNKILLTVAPGEATGRIVLQSGAFEDGTREKELKCGRYVITL